MRNLIINVFYDVNVKDIKEYNKTSDIMDVSGVLSHNYVNVRITDIKDYENIYKVSLKEYVELASNLSCFKLKKNIRELKFLDFPIYWITDISIKHPHRHWLVNLLVLKNTLQKHPDIFKKYKKIKILVKKDIDTFRELLKENLENLQFVYIKNKTQKYSLLKAIIKNTIKSIKQRPEKKQTISEFLIIYPNNITNSTISLFKNIKELVDNKNKQTFFFPYFSFLKHDVIDNDCYINQKLNIKDLFIIPLKIFKLKLNLFFYFKKRNRKNSKDYSFIKNEMFDVFNKKANSFYMYYSLRKLSKKITKKTKVFYEDEFYETGRIISKAFSENHYIKTYGIQHSVFMDTHTVYNVSDIEIKDVNNNGLPIPDKFIVWGNFFKEIFQKNNTLQKDFIIPAGNLTYIKNKTNDFVKKGKETKILYCLTSLKVFQRESKIIEGLFDIKKDINIEFRFHPLWKFDIKYIENVVKNNNINFSKEKNIKDAILNSDIIITSAHSTVFLDAVVYKRNVIRLITETDSIPNNLLYIQNCRNNNEFQTIINKLLYTEIDKPTNQIELLNLANDIWKNMIIE